MFDALFEALFSYRPVVFREGDFRFDVTTASLVAALVVGAVVKMFRLTAVNADNPAKAGVSTKPLDGTLVDLELR